jgi:hypothetical protein
MTTEQSDGACTPSFSSAELGRVVNKYSDLAFSTSTSTWKHDCPHDNGWFITVEVKVLWIFTVRRRVFVCSDCGEAKDAA